MCGVHMRSATKNEPLRKKGQPITLAYLPVPDIHLPHAYLNLDPTRMITLSCILVMQTKRKITKPSSIINRTS
jgi:hypothetical protein